MNATETAISFEELSSTPEWRALGAHMKRLLRLALQSRNLLAAVRELRPNLDAETQQRVATTVLVEPNVQAVVNLFALGVGIEVAAAPQSASVEKEVSTAPTPPATDGGSSDAELVNWGR